MQESPKSQQITSTICLLSQISSSVSEFEERSLQKLDESIVRYLSQRNLKKIQKYTMGFQKNGQLNHVNCEQRAVNVDVLSIEGLNVLHDDSQQAVFSLEKEMADFYAKKSHIEENNARVMAEFLDINEGIGIFQLCKQLIHELSKFQNIQYFCEKLAQCRKKSTEPISADLITEVEKYISNVDRYICQSDSQQQASDISDTGLSEYRIHRIGKNGREKNLLEFIE